MMEFWEFAAKMVFFAEVIPSSFSFPLQEAILSGVIREVSAKPVCPPSSSATSNANSPKVYSSISVESRHFLSDGRFMPSMT